MTTETYTPKAKLILEVERTADFKRLVQEFDKSLEAKFKKE
ncbi:MAG: hypothetical protein P4L10_17620 [Acidobacteriaceae bacterium]|nr:hypothetical protein [Acidobacteriaceae bacterium]